MKNKGKVIALAIALVVVMSAFVVIATENPVSGDQTPIDNNPNGETPAVSAPTTITAIATAVGYWETITSYDWTLTKVVGGELAQENKEVPVLQIEPGESAVVHFDIAASRSAPNIDETDGARGFVTVSNTGGNSTANLAISIVIQGLAEGTWVDLATADVNTEGKPVLGAGESFAYAYDVAFDGNGLAEFRTVACATITNFVDHVDEVYGVEASAESALPDEPTDVVLNEEAYLTDLFVVPEGFTYTASLYDGPWLLGAAGPYEFCVEYTVTNVDGTSETCYILNSQAKLSLNDTGEDIFACAKVQVYSGDFDTSLDILVTANIVSWTEDAEFGAEISSENFVDLTGGTPLEGAEPLNLTNILVRDDNNFVIKGTISLTSTGWYATRDLGLTYVVYLVNGDDWIELASVCVDVSEHPVLEACETYTYPFCVNVYLDGTQFGPFGMIHNATLVSVVTADLSNYDDEACPDGLVDITPLCLPLKQDVLTVVTKASFSSEQSHNLPQAGQYTWIRFASQLCFEQTLVITNCDGRTAVTYNTEIHAQTVVTYHCCCKEVCGVLTNDYVHCEYALICGDERTLVLSECAKSSDSDTLDVCALCYDAELNINSVLLYAGLFTLYDGDGVYALSNSMALYYGVSASMVIPEIPLLEPPVVDELPLPPADEGALPPEDEEPL